MRSQRTNQTLWLTSEGNDRTKLDNTGFNPISSELPEGKLVKVHFAGPTLLDFYLSSSNLSDRDCSRAIFIDANLSRADLGGVTFDKADFGGATLTRAGMSGATLIYANLNWANFTTSISLPPTSPAPHVNAPISKVPF